MSTEQPNPFQVGALVEMSERRYGDCRTGVVTRINGPQHIAVHRHGRPMPELYHVSVWRPAEDEGELKNTIAKTYA